MKVLRFKSTNNAEYSNQPITATVLSKNNTAENPISLYNEKQLDDDTNALSSVPCPQSAYMQDYLKNNLNKKMIIEFLVGANNLVTKTGILNEVGTDYIVLILQPDNNELLCDFYSIKFANVQS